VRKLFLGIFASGRGTNFKAIIEAIQNGRLDAEVKVLISNKENAGALSIARDNGIPTSVVSRQNFASRDLFVKTLLSTLEKYGVNFIALAGYMKKIPPEVIAAYRNRILNIHPAILPLFCGKGMYGDRVHRAVLEQGCKVTGVTVHIVDEVYDHGPIVAQQCVPVKEKDTPESLAARVLRVEHEIYAKALQLFAEERVEVREGKAIIKE